SPTCAYDDDRLRLPPASPARNSKAGKKESMGRRLNQLCPPYSTPSSNSSLDYRRSDARIVENGFATTGGVSKSAKVVLEIGGFARDTTKMAAHVLRDAFMSGQPGAFSAMRSICGVPKSQSSSARHDSIDHSACHKARRASEAKFDPRICSIWPPSG